MRIPAKTPDEYVAAVPDDRREAFTALRKTLKKNLPKGFAETMSYGMIGYVVPLSTYPAGYHADPSLPLGFIAIGSQKNFIALYHMGLYGDAALLKWFQAEYPKHAKTKLDMGKSCVRFKKPDDIPLGLIGELARKMGPQDWIKRYEKARKRV